MKVVLNKINNLIRDANPDTYDNVTFNCYLTVLADISNSVLEERERLISIINSSTDLDTESKLKLISLL